MIPTDVLIAVSQMALRSGLRLLQGYRFADMDQEHVAKLLEFMAPAPDTRWLDIGCGFGEAARLMNTLRHDLKFTLVNNSGFQLDYCPPGYPKVYADMENIPLTNASFDGCMFLYSLCHANNPGGALREAARLTKPGGELFVFDYERLEGDNFLYSQKLYAHAIRFPTMRCIADIAGWDIVARENPPGDDTLFRRLYANDEEYTTIFRDLRPVLWKAVRCV